MNIFVDGRPFVATNAGIATFLKGSLVAWAEQCPENHFYVALPKELSPTFSKENMPSNITFLQKTNIFLNKLPNIVWLNLLGRFIARQIKADLYFSALPCIPFFLPRGMKKIIVVHDVVNIEYKTTMEWRNIISNALFFTRSIKKADLVWTNSEYTCKKINEYIPKRLCKDIFTGCAVNRKVFKPIDISDAEVKEIKEKYNITNRFLLFVGSIEPRKNLEFLLSLMPQLYREDNLQLVIVGGGGWRNSYIKKIIEQNDFPIESTIFCNFVDNNDLAKLYNMANCFVSASLNEGFGMPQLEALLCGCPVITSHNSAMIEVADGKTAAYTIRGYDNKVWINKIRNIIKEKPQPVQEELSKYDWDYVVSQLRNILLSL